MDSNGDDIITPATGIGSNVGMMIVMMIVDSGVCETDSLVK